VAALGYEVTATNLQRVLLRRGVLEATGETAPSGRAGGRPAMRYRFAAPTLEVTDPFAVLRPPAGR
jgi:8-oxo-dGTP diphosphatase